MKRFKLVYLVGSARMERVVDARDEFGALFIFEGEMGDISKIVSIERVK